MIIIGLLGTLIDYAAFMNMEPIADALWKDLLVLASDPRNTVVVVSGRERALVSQCLGDLPVWSGMTIPHRSHLPYLVTTCLIWQSPRTACTTGSVAVLRSGSV